MLCEVCYFFCGRTDSYFEENAKDGTISGRNHLRKELVMKVESSSYEAYLEALEEWKQKMQETQATQQKEENSATDSYVPGISQMDMDIPMPSSTYNAQGMMSGERPPMPPMPPQETGRDRRDDGEHTGHGNDRDAGNRSDRNRGIA